MKKNRSGLNVRQQVQASSQLPDGLSDERYLRKDKEWPNLANRLGAPRILGHCFFSEVLSRIKQKGDFDNFHYLDAGCGHGNDLRAVKAALGGKGCYLGVDLSQAEIMHGLQFYNQRDGEDMRTSIKLFGLGNLHDLRHVCVWDEEAKNFSYPRSIEDGEIDLIHMEAVLQASGYGCKTYLEKKESAQQSLGELYRVCKVGGRFLGRTNVFSSAISKEQQFELLWKYDNWRFIPESDELLAMIQEAGFIVIKKNERPHEKATTNPKEKDVVRFSFLAEK